MSGFPPPTLLPLPTSQPTPLNTPSRLACCLIVQVKYQMLAAASFLAEVVKVLERLTTHAAAAASAEPDEDMVSWTHQHELPVGECI